jgi:hypothetical protein
VILKLNKITMQTDILFELFRLFLKGAGIRSTGFAHRSLGEGVAQGTGLMVESNEVRMMNKRNQNAELL